jgi:hypothetical protein
VSYSNEKCELPIHQFVAFSASRNGMRGWLLATSAKISHLFQCHNEVKQVKNANDNNSNVDNSSIVNNDSTVVYLSFAPFLPVWSTAEEIYSMEIFWVLWSDANSWQNCFFILHIYSTKDLRGRKYELSERTNCRIHDWSKFFWSFLSPILFVTTVI